MSDKFEHITQNFYGTTDEYKQQADDYARKRSNRTMNKRQTANGPTAAGTLLILLAIISLIVWGFGADRFLWIAVGSGGTGVVLVAVGAAISRR